MARTVHRPEYKRLLERLRDGRLEARLTQAAVASALDRPTSWLSDVETGIRRLDPVELMDLCELLGLDLAGLVAEWASEVRPKPSRKKLKPVASSSPRRRS